jgi:DUF4097 and DUF4098 domain-containing protein YvlB
MTRTDSLLLLLLCGALGACTNPNGDVTAGKDGGETINGSVNVPAGTHSGNIGTVNGEVEVAENAVVEKIHDVNGPIEIGTHASAASVVAVNGKISVAEGARVRSDIETVNGSITLHRGVEVGGGVRNVNGHIVLDGAHVVGSLRTTSGDIDVRGESRVDGGLTVEKNGGFFSTTDPRRPRIVIGPGAVVGGELRFEREVQLYVSESAKIGTVTGATPVKFSGETPPA